jgi:trimethylamine--corrinoid protein Co-methyltransferase
MINHPLAYTRKFTDSDIERILSVSFDVLSNTGIAVESEYIQQAMKKAGAIVEDGRIKINSKLVKESLKLVPSEFTLCARNPQRSTRIGGNTMMVAPGYGSAFVADDKGRRREATLKDFEKFAYLAYISDSIDITGGVLVEPNDVPPQLRPLEMTAALIRNSDKPFMGSVAGKDGAKESIEIAKIVFGDIKKKPCILSLININSPLHLDSRMGDAMVEYVKEGQPILLTPGIMMGITAPVTVAGALAQAFAEIFACVAIIQTINPKNPIIIGIGGFGSDLRTGGPGFGRPENALGTQLGAEIARKLNIPFRCSAAVTGARKPDCRSGYERMMTALTAFNAGAHFCLQAAGILDCINSMSYEQFVIDTEIWSYVERIAQPIKINEGTLAKNIIESNKTGLLESDHTVQYMREELYFPVLAKPENYDQWLSSESSDIISVASAKAEKIFENFQPPALDGNIERELHKYISRRKKDLQ